MAVTKNSGIRKTYYYDLSVARTGKLERVEGKHIRIANASSASAEISIAVQDNIADSYETLRKNGRIREDEGFDRIHISNTAQPGEWVRVIVSDGLYDVDNPSQSVIDSIADPVKIRGGSGRNHGQEEVDTTATEIIAANIDRTSWAVYNPSSAETLYIGSDSAVDATTGWPVPPETSMTGIDTDAVYGIYATETQDVPWMEVEA